MWEKYKSQIKKYLPLILPLLIVVGINVYFRSYPINFPQLKTQARGIIEQSIQQDIGREVYQRFQQFTNLAKDRLIKSRILEFKKQRGQDIKKQAQQLYQQIKDRYQDASGQTYLMELDGWHWSRYVENVVKLGHPGDEVVKGKQLDTLMLAPTGMILAWDTFMFYISAVLFKVFSFFKSVPLFKFVFYLPLFYIAVLTVVLYLYAYRIAGHPCAIISCLLMGASPIFMPRSCAGWFDKDTLCLIFPVLVAWTYPLAYEAKSFKWKLFWIIFSAFWIGLFSFAWMNWWFIFIIIIMYEGLWLVKINFLNWRLKEKDTAVIKQRLFSAGIFIIASIFWILIIVGIEPIKNFYIQIAQALALNKPLVTSIWPNVYYTVGELKRLNLGELTNSCGYTFIFWISLISMIILFMRAILTKKYSGFNNESIIILTLWFISMLFACFKGVRFTMFLLIPLGISLGWFINEVYKYFKNMGYKPLAFYGLIVVMAVLSFMFIKKADRTARGIFPLMNDTWYKVLTVMRDATPKDAVINSWWDFGDWFKVVSRRRVIFDGQSQNIPQAYWMARVILTDSEEEGIRILRMLNNGGNKAFETINEYIKDPLQSALLLENILTLDPDKAQASLLEYIPVSAAQEVMRLIFAAPASSAYFVVDPSLPFKIGAISYLGNWDFSKVYIVQNLNKKEKDQVIDYLIKQGRNKDELQKYYQEVSLISDAEMESWISSPLQFYSGFVNGQVKDDSTVFFDMGSQAFTYNPKEQTIYNNLRQIPRSLFIVREDNIVEIVYTNANLGLSALVTKTKGGGYRAVFLDRDLANSLFVKLYYLDGRGLRHFKSFIEAEEGNEFTRVFQILW